MAQITLDIRVAGEGHKAVCFEGWQLVNQMFQHLNAAPLLETCPECHGESVHYTDDVCDTCLGARQVRTVMRQALDTMT